MKTLINLFFKTPTTSEIAFDLGTSFLFSIKKTRTEYALYKGTSTEPIVSVKYDTGMSAEAVATLFIRTVEAMTGVALNP